jgi:hypothetical protein
VQKYKILPVIKELSSCNSNINKKIFDLLNQWDFDFVKQN